MVVGPLAHGRPLRPLVGRKGELKRITTVIHETSRGQGGVLFITGEPGIGKSRLIHEALEIAGRRRFASFFGRADPLSSDLTYAAIVEAIGTFLSHATDQRRAAYREEFPQLGLLFPEFSPPDDALQIRPDLAKMWLFDGLARFISRVAEDRPVLLAFDDIHWADSATIELIHYIARGVGGSRILVLCTFRGAELADAPLLRSMIVGLHRTGLADEMLLTRLEPEAMNAMVRELIGEEPPQELLSALQSRTAGTPLYIECIVRALRETGALVRQGDTWHVSSELAAYVPRDVRRLVLERLERLDSDVRRVLDVIAVLGDNTPHALLAEVSGLRHNDLASCIERLISAGLVEERVRKGVILYSLGHPIVGEVAYGEIPAATRQHIHMDVVGILERSPNPVDVGRIARHYRGAGVLADRKMALRAFADAGRLALKRQAVQESLKLLQDALELARESRDRDTLLSLLESLGESYDRAGDFERAMACWNEGRTVAEERNHRTALARLHRHLARACLFLGQFDEAERQLIKGIGIKGEQGSQELADLYFTWLSLLGHRGDWAGGGPVIARLSDLAKDHPDDRTTAMAKLGESLPIRAQMRFRRAIPLLVQAHSAAKRSGDSEVLQSVALSLSGTLCVLGDHKEALGYAEMGIDEARRNGTRPLPCAELYVVVAHLLAGRTEQALRYSTAYVEDCRRVSEQLAPSFGVHALVLSRVGRLDEAYEHIKDVREAAAASDISDIEMEFVYLPAAAVALEAGDAEKALASARGFADSRWFPTFPALGWFLLAEAQVSCGRIDDALQTVDRLLRFEEGGEYALGLGLLAQGLVHARGGEKAVAVESLRRGSKEFNRLELPFEEARCNYEVARLLGDGPERESLLSLAVQGFQRSGAGRWVDTAQRLIDGSSPAKNGGAQGTPLSARELEVAQLVAEGLSNEEIADRLFISRRTVTTHLTRIYGRLGLTSRVTLARYVSEQEHSAERDSS